MTATVTGTAIKKFKMTVTVPVTAGPSDCDCDCAVKKLWLCPPMSTLNSWLNFSKNRIEFWLALTMRRMRICQESPAILTRRWCLCDMAFYGLLLPFLSSCFAISASTRWWTENKKECLTFFSFFFIILASLKSQANRSESVEAFILWRALGGCSVGDGSSFF